MPRQPLPPLLGGRFGGNFTIRSAAPLSLAGSGAPLRRRSPGRFPRSVPAMRGLPLLRRQSSAQGVRALLHRLARLPAHLFAFPAFAGYQGYQQRAGLSSPAALQQARHVVRSHVPSINTASSFISYRYRGMLFSFSDRECHGNEDCRYRTLLCCSLFSLRYAHLDVSEREWADSNVQYDGYRLDRRSNGATHACRLCRKDAGRRLPFSIEGHSCPAAQP